MCYAFYLHLVYVRACLFIFRVVYLYFIILSTYAFWLKMLTWKCSLFNFYFPVYILINLLLFYISLRWYVNSARRCNYQYSEYRNQDCVKANSFTFYLRRQTDSCHVVLFFYVHNVYTNKRSVLKKCQIWPRKKKLRSNSYSKFRIQWTEHVSKGEVF